MARLIDADALREYYNVTDPAGTFAYCDTILQTIDGQPTIPAIPVEWLLDVLEEAKEFPRSEHETIVAIPYLIKRWQKEQEAR